MNRGEGKVRGRLNALFLTAIALFAVAPARAADEETPAPSDLDALVRRLGDPDPGVRARAFDGLLSWGARDPARALSALSKEDPDPEIQASLLKLRREIPWESVCRATLRAIADRPPGVPKLVDQALREAAARAPHPVLDARTGEVRAPAEWAAQNPVLKNLRNTKTPDSQEAAGHVAAAFIEHPDNPTLWQAGADYFYDPHHPFPERLFPRAKGFLDDSDPDVRSTGLRLLVRAGVASAAPRVLEMVLNDRSMHVRTVAVQLLTQSGFNTSGTALALFPLLDDPGLDGDDSREGQAKRHLRANVCQTIARLKAPGAIPPLLALLSHARAPVREAAAVTLGLAGSEIVDVEKTAPLLVARVKGESSGAAREAAMLALGRLKAVAAADLLKGILDDREENLRTRRLVHAALKELGIEAPFPEPGVMLPGLDATVKDAPLPEGVAEPERK